MSGSPRAPRSPAAWAALVAGGALLTMGSVALFLTVCPALQLTSRPAVLAAAFAPYALLAFPAAALLLWWTVQGRSGAAIGAAALVLMSALGCNLRHYWPAPPPATAAAEQPLAVMSMNLRCLERSVPELKELVAETGPDIVVVLGLFENQIDRFDLGSDPRLPHVAFFPMPDLPECGTLVLSAYPLTDEVPGPQPSLTIKWPTTSLTLVPVDLPTPGNGLQPWLDEFDDLTDALVTSDGAVIAVGDFNAVREHAPLRDLIDGTGLRHALDDTGAGWLPTFRPASWLPPMVALDHALLSDDLHAVDVLTATVHTQRHQALIVEVDAAGPS